MCVREKEALPFFFVLSLALSVLLVSFNSVLRTAFFCKRFHLLVLLFSLLTSTSFFPCCDCTPLSTAYSRVVVVAIVAAYIV